jgi:hypothetical protein
MHAFSIKRFALGHPQQIVIKADSPESRRRKSSVRYVGSPRLINL